MLTLFVNTRLHHQAIAVSLGRLRMARDLHDTIGHSIAVIALHAGVAQEALGRDLVAELTEREREFLRHVGLGESNDEIARKLVISPATARTYVSRLLAKLAARDRSQLVILAYESGLITPGQT